MRKQAALFLLVLSTISSVSAQGVRFVTNAPPTAVKGIRFQLQYVLQGGRGSNLDVPDAIKGFSILFGPAPSTTSTTCTYTYTLVPTTEGTYMLPGASIEVDGRTYQSKPQQIKVLPPDKNATTPKAGQQTEATSSSSVAGKISTTDVFVRAIFSKPKVYEQEAVLVTFRFYSVLDFREVGKIVFPEFEGFITEDIELPMNRQQRLESYKGRNYVTIDIKKTLLFPQRSGKITIPSGTIDLVFAVKSGKRVKVMGQYVDVMAEERRTLKTAPETIDINALPSDNKPINFSGGVGVFTFSPSISTQRVTANEPVIYKVAITGTGNMKLIKNPELKLPIDLELSDPKVENNYTMTDNGLSGTKIIEYTFTPRTEGRYTIPPVQFSYYDLHSKSYKTITSPSYPLVVNKDPHAGNGKSSNYMSEKDVEVENDIRYLKIGKFDFQNTGAFFVGSVTYILFYILPFFLFLTFVFIYRKQIKANANSNLMRTKKANKVALRRLKLANKYLTINNKDGFYEEVLRAVWGYLSDKLSIPVADLNRKNIAIELKNDEVGETLIGEFIKILDTCEFARYAPAEASDAMAILYHATIDAIGEMENRKKQRNKETRMKQIILSLFLFSSASLFAIGGDIEQQMLEDYKKNDFENVINLLETTKDAKIQGVESSMLYYNLGNAYFRSNNLAKAMLYYERASLLNPSDRDIQHNIAYTTTKLEDKIVIADTFFLTNWFRSIQNLNNTNTWATIAIIAFILFMSCLSLFFFGRGIKIKKGAFYFGILLFLVVVFANIFSFNQKREIEQRDTAIIMLNAVSISSSPELDGKEFVVLHAGTKVRITKKDRNWLEIEIADGSIGWVQQDKVEII